MNRLTGKVAIVTGAGRGIGHAIAELYAAEGATVVATSRASEGEAREGIEYRQLVVESEQDWKSVVDSTVEQHGRVDILVNNAGIIGYESVCELSLEEWNRVIAVNQTGTWLGMREVVPVMRSNGGGSIINISSIWGTVAVSGAHAYHATKGAVRNMSKSAAITYATENIRVNSLHPGFVRTPLTEAQDPTVNEWVVSRTPVGRAGEPIEIAQGAVFLGSDESSFMTGAELVIDGGYLAQ